MAGIKEIVQAKFPDKRWGRDFRTQNDRDGRGEYISHWSSAMGVPLPDAATLAVWEAETAGDLAELERKRALKRSVRDGTYTRPSQSIPEMHQTLMDILDILEAK